MNNYRQLSPAAYLVAAVLVVFPLFDSGLSLSPWNVGSAQWRFGAIGMLSNTLMIVALGAFIAVATAVSLNQDRARRILGFTSWLLAVVLLGGIAAFALDAVQARPQIRADMMFSYQLASLTAEVKLLLGALSFALFGRGCRIESPARQAGGSGPAVLVSKRDKAALNG